MIPPDSARGAEPEQTKIVRPDPPRATRIPDDPPEDRKPMPTKDAKWFVEGKPAARAAESEGPTPAIKRLAEVLDKAIVIRGARVGDDRVTGWRLDEADVRRIGLAVADVRTEVERLRAEVAAAREDTRRLDWMQVRVEGTGDTMQFGGVCYWGIEIKRGKNGRPTRIGDGDDLRSAIDAARSPSTPDTPPVHQETKDG